MERIETGMCGGIDFRALGQGGRKWGGSALGHGPPRPTIGQGCPTRRGQGTAPPPDPGGNGPGACSLFCVRGRVQRVGSYRKRIRHAIVMVEIRSPTFADECQR